MLHLPAASTTRTDPVSTTPAAGHAPLFERLRTETALAHRDLESRLDLASDTLDVPRYVRLLRNFRRATAAYETVVASVLPAPLQPMFESRRKTAMLDDDLRFFDARPDDHAPEQAAMEHLVGLDRHAAVGAMYVFEGSTLGGAVVARHLERQLGLKTLQGRSYFTPYPGRTGAMWHAFKERVDATVGDDPSAHDAIVCCAGATFAWLARVLPSRS